VTLLNCISKTQQYKTIILHFGETEVANRFHYHWINDGLMTIFFLLIGLKLEVRKYIRIVSIKDETLPFFGALGGMLITRWYFFIAKLCFSTQNGRFLWLQCAFTIEF
jgi:NhaA family Na+:H+ antiporter